MIAIASAKINAMIIVTRILGAAKGFLPSALMAECPTIAMTAAGPAVQISIITTIRNSRIVF